MTVDETSTSMIEMMVAYHTTEHLFELNQRYGLDYLTKNSRWSFEHPTFIRKPK
jgi:hypothetical protein